MFRQFFNQSSVVNISPEQASLKQKAEAIIVDVREPSEWQEGHINNAIQIPLGSLPKRLAELDREREIITVCRSGQRRRSCRTTVAAGGIFPGEQSGRRYEHLDAPTVPSEESIGRWLGMRVSASKHSHTVFRFGCADSY